MGVWRIKWLKIFMLVIYVFRFISSKCRTLMINLRALILTNYIHLSIDDEFKSDDSNNYILLSMVNLI